MLSFDQLPSSQPGTQISLEIPTEAAINKMARVFADIMTTSGWSSKEASYKHFSPVEGLSGSCRLLADRPFLGSVSMLPPLTPDGLASEFLTEFCLAARFPPPPHPDVRGVAHWSRCFEVRSLLFDKRPSTLVIAGWMENQSE